MSPATTCGRLLTPHQVRHAQRLASARLEEHAIASILEVPVDTVLRTFRRPPTSDRTASGTPGLASCVDHDLAAVMPAW